VAIWLGNNTEKKFDANFQVLQRRRKNYTTMILPFQYPQELCQDGKGAIISC
jgi:hypothetical protein